MAMWSGYIGVDPALIPYWERGDFFSNRSPFGNSSSKSGSKSSSSTPPWLGGSGTGGGGQAPAAAQWKFPQYSQTWAFTPPAPTPYVLPPAFDRESDTGYAKSASGLSLSGLMAKYK